jgi:hypothetical protein
MQQQCSINAAVVQQQYSSSNAAAAAVAAAVAAAAAAVAAAVQQQCSSSAAGEQYSRPITEPLCPHPTPSQELLGLATASEVDSQLWYCVICTEGGELMCCDGCPRTYHLPCLGMKRAPKGEWLCRHCREQQVRARPAGWWWPGWRAWRWLRQHDAGLLLVLEACPSHAAALELGTDALPGTCGCGVAMHHICGNRCPLHVLQRAAAHQRLPRADCRQLQLLLALISQQASAAAAGREQGAAPSGRGGRRQLQRVQRTPASSSSTSSSSSTCIKPRLGSA